MNRTTARGRGLIAPQGGAWRILNTPTLSVMRIALAYFLKTRLLYLPVRLLVANNRSHFSWFKQKTNLRRDLGGAQNPWEDP